MDFTRAAAISQVFFCIFLLNNSFILIEEIHIDFSVWVNWEEFKLTFRERLFKMLGNWMVHLCSMSIMFAHMGTLNTLVCPAPHYVTWLIQQPMRAKHCQTCQHCVRRYDHHCPWIENCVGERNHRWFVLYLAVQLLVLVWGLHMAWWVTALTP